MPISKTDLVSLFLRDASPNGWTVEDALSGFDDAGIAGDFFPFENDIFKALASMRPEEVKYLVVGKDPYPKEANGHPYATGIAFEVNELCEVIPDSLKRLVRSIYIDDPFIDEINDWIDNGDVVQVNSAFRHWIKEHQVLMINSAFTVPRMVNDGRTRDVAGGHVAKWHAFTSAIVAQVIRKNSEAKLIAWGAEAREVICSALEMANIFSYFYHPSFRYKAKGYIPEKDFDSFWTETDVGRSLTIPQQP